MAGKCRKTLDLQGPGRPSLHPVIIARKLLRPAVLPFAATAMVVSSPAAAQDDAEPAAETPDDDPVIIVTGSALEETPAAEVYATRTLDREEIVTTSSGRIEDALSSIAGFQQFRRSDSRSSNPSAQGATLRALGGNASSRALVLLDGVPMSDPFFGFIPYSALAPERLDSIRVVRGGGAGPFGAGALAGTIELASAGPQTLGDFGAHLYANDRGGTEAGAHLAGDLGHGFGVVSGRWDRDKGFYTTPETDRVDASIRAAHESWSVEARGVAPLGETVELQARGLLYDDRRSLRFEGADSSSTGQDASVRLVGRGEWAFEALAYLQQRNFTNTVVSSTRFVPVLDQRNTPSTGLGGKLEVRPPVGDLHTLRIGVDYRRSEGELFETALSAFTGAVRERRNAGGVNSDIGLFVEDDFTLDRLTVTAGARIDRYTIADGFYTARDPDGDLLVENRFTDRSGWEPSLRGGLAYDVGSGITLRGAAYMGLRLPTLNELYRPFVIFPVTTEANAALEPEKLEGFEIGADFEAGDAFALSLTAFDNRVEGAIANVTLDSVTRRRQNIDAIEARGLEALARLAFGRFRLDTAWAYTKARAREEGAAFDGNRPAQTPAWAGSASLRYTLGETGQFALTLRHVGKQFEDDLQSDVLPAATTLGAHAQIPLKDGFALVLRGENLTDETIVTRNQSGSIDLGTPRTFWAGFKVAL